MIVWIVLAVVVLLLGMLVTVLYANMIDAGVRKALKAENAELLALGERIEVLENPPRDEAGRFVAREGYSVGAEKHVPWSVRKREKEAAARTKRAQLEAFREVE